MSNKQLIRYWTIYLIVIFLSVTAGGFIAFIIAKGLGIL